MTLLCLGTEHTQVGLHERLDTLVLVAKVFRRIPGLEKERLEGLGVLGDGGLESLDANREVVHKFVDFVRYVVAVIVVVVDLDPPRFNDAQAIVHPLHGVEEIAVPECDVAVVEELIEVCLVWRAEVDSRHHCQGDVVVSHRGLIAFGFEFASVYRLQPRHRIVRRVDRL